MEIIAEMLFGLLQVIVEVFGELILQLLVEILVEVGLRKTLAPMNWPKPNPWMAAFGYTMLGAAAAALSLWVHPALWITSQVGRITNLIVTPIVAGLVMSAIGVWREKRGDAALRIDRFSYGFLFAATMGLIRFLFARA